MNFEKEQERLSSLTIIEKRYSFLFEDVWFILIQYMYFEKFVVRNAVYLAEKSGEDPLNDEIVNYEWSPNSWEKENQINQWDDAVKQWLLSTLVLRKFQLRFMKNLTSSSDFVYSN